jgi:hypothetical protein
LWRPEVGGAAEDRFAVDSVCSSMTAYDRTIKLGECTVNMASPRWDVAVIGAGVVGCAVARRFALADARVILVERALTSSRVFPNRTAPFRIPDSKPPLESRVGADPSGPPEYLEIYHESEIAAHHGPWP